MKQHLLGGPGERDYRGSVLLDSIREGPQGTSSSLHRRTLNEFNDGHGWNNPDSLYLSLMLFFRTDTDQSALIMGRTVWQIFLDGEEVHGRMKGRIQTAAPDSAAATPMM